MLPSITVVTITLNAAKTFPDLLISLRGQTDRDFKFLVMDGASGDGTIALVKEAKDIVTLSVSEPDTGFYDALNKAIRLVNTSHYLVIGADDTLTPNAVADYKEAVTRTDADMVIAAVKAGAKILKGYRPELRWRAPSAMITSHSVGTLIKTALHEQFGPYSLRYPIYADSLFVKRVCIACNTKVVDGGFLAGEFCTKGGISTSNVVRSLCELWMVQRETGEKPLLQYVLFQLRLLRHLGRIIS